MNKLIGAIIAVMALAVIATPALAATTVDTTWNGAGGLSIDFLSGDDAESHFSTWGSNGIAGEFHGKDYDDNPYNYGVDSTDSFVKASIIGNGGGEPNSFMSFENKRLDSKSMYGSSGQRTYTEILTDGTGEMSWGSRTNYASMSNCQYGRSPKTSSGKNFEATGNHEIYHEITDSDGDGALIDVYGYGATTSKIKLQGETSGGSSFNMGHLGVCGDGEAWCNNYATFSGTGAGDFYVSAWADNDLSIHNSGTPWTVPGDGSDDSATYDLHVGYVGTWSMPDFGVKGN